MFPLVCMISLFFKFFRDSKIIVSSCDGGNCLTMFLVWYSSARTNNRKIFQRGLCVGSQKEISSNQKCAKNI